MATSGVRDKEYFAGVLESNQAFFGRIFNRPRTVSMNEKYAEYTYKNSQREKYLNADYSGCLLT